MSLYTSVLTAGTNSHEETSENVNAVATDFIAQGVIGTIGNTAGVAPSTGAFAVNAQGSPNMTVAVNSGVAYVSATPSSQDSQMLRVRSTASQNVTISSNSSGSTKYDWIYLQIDATKAANPASDASDVATLFVSRSSSSTTDNGTPPTYGINIAVVTVANGAASITNSNIADTRAKSSIGSSSSGASGWTPLGYGITYGANNGNREFTITSSNDLTGILSPGTRFSIARTTTPPTQCMSFASASSQYASNASPSGITFTSAYTCEAWVKVLSYTGSSQTVVSRYNGTNGFGLQLDSSGRLVLFASSTTYQTSYQSVPLNRWIHLGGTFSSGTMVLYMDGVVVPSSLAGSGTSITQAGSLEIGAANSTAFLNGYVSEARIWSVAQTQANIQANMAINLGTTTNLVGVWQGNGAWTDGSGNSNTLTAQNSASNTQATNPFNATEYAIVTKASYSNPTTTATLFCPIGYTIPNQALSNPYYSAASSPYGFPRGRELWRVKALYRNTLTQSSPASGTWYNPGSTQLSIPTGEFVAWYEGSLYAQNTTNAPSGFSTLSTANNSESDTEMTVRPVYTGSLTSAMGNAYRTRGYNNTSQTTYYLNIKTDDASATQVTWAPSAENTIIEAESAYI